jgi:hypothetical protein
MIMRIIMLALVATLAGCGTRYQDMGLTGGVAAEQMTADVYRIKSRGNAYTDKTTVQDYVLLKAAETTKSAGGTHFLLISGQDASRQVTVTSPGSATTTVAGGVAVTSYSPPTSDTVIKPGQDAYVRILKVSAGQQAPAGAFSADEIVKFVGSRVQRS